MSFQSQRGGNSRLVLLFRCKQGCCYAHYQINTIHHVNKQLIMGNHKVLRTAGCNLRYSMYEFIEAVHKHSIIWERRHPNFHNRELRDLAWQQIGQELCNNFEAASEPEKQEIGMFCLNFLCKYIITF